MDCRPKKSKIYAGTDNIEKMTIANQRKRINQVSLSFSEPPISFRKRNGSARYNFMFDKKRLFLVKTKPQQLKKIKQAAALPMLLRRL